MRSACKTHDLTETMYIFKIKRTWRETWIIILHLRGWAVCSTRLRGWIYFHQVWRSTLTTKWAICTCYTINAARLTLICAINHYFSHSRRAIFHANTLNSHQVRITANAYWRWNTSHAAIRAWHTNAWTIKIVFPKVSNTRAIEKSKTFTACCTISLDAGRASSLCIHESSLWAFRKTTVIKHQCLIIIRKTTAACAISRHIWTWLTGCIAQFGGSGINCGRLSGSHRQAVYVESRDQPWCETGWWRWKYNKITVYAYI